MQIFFCFIDFICNNDFILDALQRRQPYGEEYKTDFDATPRNSASVAGTRSVIKKKRIGSLVPILMERYSKRDELPLVNCGQAQTKK